MNIELQLLSYLVSSISGSKYINMLQWSSPVSWAVCCVSGFQKINWVKYYILGKIHNITASTLVLCSIDSANSLQISAIFMSAYHKTVLSKREIYMERIRGNVSYLELFLRTDDNLMSSRHVWGFSLFQYVWLGNRQHCAVDDTDENNGGAVSQLNFLCLNAGKAKPPSCLYNDHMK